MVGERDYQKSWRNQETSTGDESQEEEPRDRMQLTRKRDSSQGEDIAGRPAQDVRGARVTAVWVGSLDEAHPRESGEPEISSREDTPVSSGYETREELGVSSGECTPVSEKAGKMGNMARELLEAEQPMEQNPEEPGGREPNLAQESVDRTPEQEPGEDQDAERNLPQKGIYGEHERTSCPDYRCLPPSAVGTASRERGGDEEVSAQQQSERTSNPAGARAAAAERCLPSYSAAPPGIRHTGVHAPFKPDLGLQPPGNNPYLRLCLA